MSELVSFRKAYERIKASSSLKCRIFNDLSAKAMASSMVVTIAQCSQLKLLNAHQTGSFFLLCSGCVKPLSSKLSSFFSPEPIVCYALELGVIVSRLTSTFLFPGAVLPRRVRLRQRSHPEQLEQVSEEDQGVHQTVRRHLSLLHRTVQVHRRRNRERVSALIDSWPRKSRGQFHESGFGENCS